jgi:hypothetical protein
MIGVTLLFVFSGYMVASRSEHWEKAVGAMIVPYLFVYMTYRIFRESP